MVIPDLAWIRLSEAAMRSEATRPVQISSGAFRTCSWAEATVVATALQATPRLYPSPLPIRYKALGARPKRNTKLE